MNSKCQIFTSQKHAEKMLDSIGYTHNLYAKKILENSCGVGNILIVIVTRYIEDCLSKGFTKRQIKVGLEKDIYGVEIDKRLKRKCLNKLNIIIREYDIPKVKWQIISSDYLRNQNSIKYDYIVGNPPYITYAEMKLEDRIYLKKNYKSCQKGKFDYCYAFIEKSIESLSSRGKMAYLIPSSVFKTVFGESVRKIMCPHVVMINDYTMDRLFKNATVKAAIVIIDKNTTKQSIRYVDDTTGIDVEIRRDRLKDKWIFGKSNLGKRKFGDYYRVAHAVATLYNDAFVIKKWRLTDEGNYIVGNYIIDSEMVRDSASPKSLKKQKDEKIIFPYSYDDNNKLIRYEEIEFQTKFSKTCKYLSVYRDGLDKRNSDSQAQWFEYGRSQALNNLNYEKLLISPIVSKEMIVFKLDKKCIPYSGMYVIAKGDKMTLDDGMKILQSKDFLTYVRNIGIPINGKSMRITSKDIENYRFNY